MSVDPSILESIEVLRDVPPAEVAWLAGQCRERHLDTGEVLFESNAQAEEMFFIVSGALQIQRREGGHEIASYKVEAGEVGGRLPFSRMVLYEVNFVAMTPCHITLLDRAHFDALRAHAPTVEERLVHRMLDRTRDVTRFDVSREKLAALGTMSAGLAHELNNPASAAQRTAQDLAETLQAFDEHSSAIVREFVFKDPQCHGGDPFSPVYEQMTLESPAGSALEQSDLEDELSDWLEGHGVAEPWNAAATLVAGGFTKTFLEGFVQALVPDQVRNVLEWIPRDVDMRLLSRTMVESTERIAELVGAMKSYSYMDQGVAKTEVDVHAGIDTTLRVLAHKLKPKKVEVIRTYDESLPKILAYGSELNQVWTNLIDNAVAALEEGGTLTIATTWDAGADIACIDVIDDGGGIPDAIQERIFEPFFTTRPVGEGTGLGLDITHRIVARHHHGTIQVASRPGRTRFRVRLPIT